MINIKTKDELYEFSIRNSTEFRLGFPDRDRDVTISFYDTEYSHHDKCYKIEGCDVTICLPEKRTSYIQAIQDIHFVGCHIKNIKGLDGVTFLHCCFSNCEIEDDVGSDFLECLISNTLIKSSSTFERIFKYKACVLDKVTFSGPKGWAYDKDGKNYNYKEHYSYWSFAFSSMKSCSMFIDGESKEISKIFILEQKDNPDISMTYFTDKSAIFISPSVTINVVNIDDIRYFYATKTYFFKKVSFLQSIADSFDVNKVDATEDASLISEMTKYKAKVEKYVFEQWEGSVYNFDTPYKDISYQNKFRSIECVLRNKFKPDDTVIKKNKSMIRTVVLYNNRQYWVDKSITGHDTVRIDMIQGSNVNSKMRLVTQEGNYIRATGITSAKEFCKKIGIHVNDDDVILFAEAKLIDALVLRGDFRTGTNLVQEYYGTYNGKYGEEFTYEPVCGHL
jgi:hypothetical protein